MVLKMTRPFKHPKTGIYQYRKRVPQHLIPLVGKTEEKASLGTRDPAEAKIAHAKVSAEVEARWSQLSKGRITLTFKQAVAMAGEIYREFVAANEDWPDKASVTLRMYAEEKLKISGLTWMIVGADKERSLEIMNKMAAKHRKEIENPAEMDAYLKKRGILLDDESHELLRKETSKAMAEARHLIGKYASGNFVQDENVKRFPALEIEPVSRGQKKAESLPEKYLITQIFEDYAKEKEISPATYKKWKPIILKVAAEVPDARDLTKQWCIDWKDKLLRSDLSQATVKDAYLAALRTVCAWGVTNNRLSSNPLDGVTVSVPKKKKTRQPYFTNDEAATILRATLQPQSERMAYQMRGAYRWLPWLCAYSGARVGEIAQLRKQDIQEDNGIWLMWITPEAGSTKNGAARFVAIHPHLIEQGFLDFVKKSKKDAPLFYDPARRRGGTDANPQYKKVGERIASWVREIGVDDDQIQPNHAWRHGFKTRARKVHMDVGARDYMQGHVSATEGEQYGEFEADVLLYEISKLPRFEI